MNKEFLFIVIDSGISADRTFDEFEDEVEPLVTNIIDNIDRLHLADTCELMRNESSLTIQGTRATLAPIANHLKKTRQGLVMVIPSWEMLG
ncbi:MAG TPA: hypothetical protein VJK52_05280 [Candidatus Nanoarchaeia archaeon]|nr:MAG: hypothetical protein A3B61_03580 [Candidatus Peribacteria bacterium RIFCSPLOWO2_01_FULL_53_10]OGJ70683.1 MAG: hypothetical protein A3G69_01545 [Candidatus Peribacteria bacterium RIFCSPLOWO2_12_FULL_53_10]HLC67023.1 hypothetical protein [Candidatus Nanoarchaeia archaeon]